MGYNCDFDIQVTPPVEAVICSGDYDLKTDSNGKCSLWGTWYDHREDMTAVSKEYPDHVFRVVCKGEERDDRSTVTWYKNGKSYSWEEPPMQIPEFDESKLK